MKCSNCGKEFHDGIFCPECGIKIENVSENDESHENGDSEGKEAQQDKEDKSEAAVCPKCGEKFEIGLSFCPFCGTKLISGRIYGGAGNGSAQGAAGVPAQGNTGRQQKKTKLRGIVIAAAVCVVVFTVAGGLLTNVSYDSEQEERVSAGESELPAEEIANEDGSVENEETEQIDETEMPDEEAALQNQEWEMEEEVTDMQTEEGMNPEYEKWIGNYARTLGPSSGISIWSVDESGIMFAAGIGGSGYLAYRDIRDCNAEWVSDSVAVYVDEYDNGGRIEMSLLEDGTLSIIEERADMENILPLSGVYEKSEGQDQSDYEFVLPDSDRRLITESDLVNLNPVECRIARNEIYARRGRMFADEQLQNYFDVCTWYQREIAGEDFSLDMLSDIERENAEFISAYEETMGYK